MTTPRTASGRVTCDSRDLTRALAAALPVAYRKKDRLELCGVYLSAQDGRITVEACNRAVAARARLDAFESTLGFGCLIPTPVAKRIVAVFGTECGECVIEGDGVNVKVDCAAGTVRFAVAPGLSFPDLSKAWPTGDPVEMPRLQLKRRVMATVASAFAKATGKSNPGISYYSFADSPAYLAESPDTDALLCVAMPFDDGDSADAEQTDARQVAMFADAAGKENGGTR